MRQSRSVPHQIRRNPSLGHRFWPDRGVDPGRGTIHRGEDRLKPVDLHRSAHEDRQGDPRLNWIGLETPAQPFGVPIASISWDYRCEWIFSWGYRCEWSERKYGFESKGRINPLKQGRMHCERCFRGGSASSIPSATSIDETEPSGNFPR